MAPAPKSWVETGPAPSLSRAPCGRRSKPRLSHTGLLFFILLLAVPLHAKSWRIADYQDTIGINQDGRAVVRERITLVFIGEWHGIHRTIPLEYPGPRGTNYTLFVDVRSITDGSGDGAADLRGRHHCREPADRGRFSRRIRNRHWRTCRLRQAPFPRSCAMPDVRRGQN